MKKILNHLQADWYKYTIELIVITAGILGAFILNSWKEDRDRQGEESTILLGLKQEFEVNLVDVNRNIALNAAEVKSTILVIEQIRKKNPFANQVYFDSLLYAMYWYGTFDAQTGLIDEVIGSGKLSILKDSELRNRLTKISGLLDNLEEDYEIRSGFYLHQVLPYLTKHFALANADQYMDLSSWSDDYKSKRLSESPFKVKTPEVDLLQFENHVWQHKVNSEFANLSEYELQKFFIETLKIIDANLERVK
ncbi:MAG: hypothetical protein AB8B73_12050 [Ekhidna sp.]